MLYPKNIEQKLGFDKIKELLSEECMSSLGRSFVDKIKFSDRFDTVKKLIDQAAEFRLILQTESSFPNQNYLDVLPYVKKAALQGAFLDEEEFFEIKLSLTTIQSIFHFFKNKEQQLFPQLRQLVENAHPDHNGNGWLPLITGINAILDERGKVKDNASKELYDIRRRLSAEQQNVKRTLDRIYKTARNSGWIGDEMTLTVRNGRLVIPVLAEHKRKLQGFVHDESASGQIAFVEPGEVLEANNEIRDLEIKERREVIKILERLTDTLRPHIGDLERSYMFLGLMDFIRAKARFAQKINAHHCLLVDDQIVDWTMAVHPLLFLAHQKLGKPVVALNVNLTEEERILVVSGPNAGGKSVMLKTIGLLQYMSQCGLLVSVTPDSKVGIFKNLFIDIGDEQSIENDLSTYSSHLTNMRAFVTHSDGRTLFLIDEFGTGTEPSLGGAIAEAILEQLVKNKAFGVVNTHYTNLKVYADKNKGLINGAMKFDAEKLEPLYSLEIGQPGSSFALEVAQKIGLPPHLIKNAKNKLSKTQLNFEKLLKELEIEKKVFEEQNASLRKEMQELKTKTEQYKVLKDFLENDKKRIINDAKAQASGLLKEANKKIEGTIREIRESKAEKVATQEVRKQLDDFKEKIILEKVVKEQIINTPEWAIAEGIIKVGDDVQVKGQETIGKVIAIKGKDAEVALGELKSVIKINRLQKISHKQAKKEAKGRSLGGVDFNEKMTNFSFNLDIRGKRGEEALGLVDSLMDDAILLGYPEIRIVHGKGDGILRTLIRNHLKLYKQIRSMSDEHADRGGQGVTVVDMR